MDGNKASVSGKVQRIAFCAGFSQPVASLCTIRLRCVTCGISWPSRRRVTSAAPRIASAFRSPVSHSKSASSNLRYELLCTDEFALIVAENHSWAKRRIIAFSELDHQRLLQLPDSFVMRRMIDEICRKHQVRPRVVAEINAIETLLRSLGPLQSGALMPKVTLRGRQNLKLRAIPLLGKKLRLEIGLLRLRDSPTNTALADFTSLAKRTVPRMVAKQKRAFHSN